MHHESQSPAFRRQWSTTVKMSKDTAGDEETPQEKPAKIQEEKEVWISI